MNRYIVLSLLITLNCTLLHSAVTYHIDLSTGELTNSIATVPIREITYMDNGIGIKYKIQSISLNQSYDSESITKWEIPGFTTRLQENEAKLPIRIDKFNIPEHYNVELTFNVESYSDFHSEIEFTSDVNFSNEIYPLQTNIKDCSYNLLKQQPVYIKEIETFRGYKIISVEVSPTIYYPDEQRLRVITSLSYDLTYKESSAAILSTQTQEPQSINSFAIGDLSMPIINPSHAIENKTNNGGEIDIAGPNGRDYLIITHKSFKDAADKLARWKRRLGYNVTVTTNLLWTNEKIQNTINLAYKATPKLTYILLLGDSSFLPPYMDVITKTSSSYTCDYNYAYDYKFGCMDGDDDWLSEFSIGRIPVSDIEEADAVIDKIINYEFFPPQDPTIFQNVVSCAYLEDTNNDNAEDRRFLRTAEELYSYISNNLYKTVKRLYKRQRATTNYYSKTYYKYEEIPSELIASNIWNANASNIASAINNGACMFFYNGHGTESGLTNVDFKLSSLRLLTNTFQPVFFCPACLTGAYHFLETTKTPIRSFAQDILKLKDAGASAIFASSCMSYVLFEDAFQLGIIDAICPPYTMQPPIFGNVSSSPQYNLRTLKYHRLGDIFTHALTRMVEWNNPYDTYGQKYHKKVLQLFGDPTMPLYWKQPKPIDGILVYRPNNLIKTYIPVDGCTITYFNEFTGEIFFNSNVSKGYSYFDTNNPDVFTITVTSPDRVPYVNIAPEYLYTLE